MIKKMLDLSKYEGHTPGPWSDKETGQNENFSGDIMPPDEYLHWTDNGTHTHTNKGQPIVECDGGYYGPYGADRLLVKDAPLLLEELKRIYNEIDKL